MISSRLFFGHKGDLYRNLKVIAKTEKKPLDEMRQANAPGLVVEAKRMFREIGAAKSGWIQMRKQ
jgi:hypothetical protein